jgi:hypothetical protein
MLDGVEVHLFGENTLQLVCVVASCVFLILPYFATVLSHPASSAFIEPFFRPLRFGTGQIFCSRPSCREGEVSLSI